MIIYYKVITVFCEYPFHQEVDKRYCVFSYSLKKFNEIHGLEIESNTSIKQKEDYLKKELNLKHINLIKTK